MTTALHGDKSSAADQIIDYPERPGWTGYAFSIWSFPLENFAGIIREYFTFCRAYYTRTGFRCDLPYGGYGVRQDSSAVFSYSRAGHVFTLDPVCGVPGPAWDEFLAAYNEFCSQHGGCPLLNQTAALTAVQMQRAFGPQIAEFLQVRSQLDPSGRFYNAYFRELFEANVLS
jgi:L-gulonolactone oxidase